MMVNYILNQVLLADFSLLRVKQIPTNAPETGSALRNSGPRG